ncbi:down-regulator of transcription 1 [Pancytospora philotis]|nr:down-regulator of transcription 1 [Pancytospora philotis]
MPYDKSDEDTNLPKATVDKLIHDTLHKPFIVSKEVKSALKDACHLFVNRIITEANAVCEVDKKKIIANQHIYKAYTKYGFADYIEPCQAAAADYDDYSRHRPSRQNKFKDSGKTLDELHEDQMRLFQAARKEQEIAYGVADDDSSEGSQDGGSSASSHSQA